MAVSVPRKRAKVWDKWRKNLIAYSFVFPAAAIMILFVYLPVIMAFYLSLYDWDLINPKTFVALNNYGEVLSSPEFYKALKNTLYFVAVQMSLDFVLSLGIAVLLNQKIRGLSFYRTLFFSPVVTPMVAVSAVWMWLYDPFNGLFNYVLEKIGLSPIGWLNSPNWAMPAVILMSVWKGLGYNIVIFLAGLQGIPIEFYEAAAIDGANSWKQFRHVTLPLLSPTMYFVLIMGIINSFKVFTQIDVMTPGGGPLKSTMVLVYLIYTKAFNSFRFGIASTLSVILFLIILTITIFQRTVVEKRVHYS